LGLTVADTLSGVTRQIFDEYNCELGIWDLLTLVVPLLAWGWLLPIPLLGFTRQIFANGKLSLWDLGTLLFWGWL
jgi:hypothetical protein